VTLGTISLQILSATNTTISARIPASSVLAEPLVLTVTNPATGKKGTWTGITVTPDSWDEAPTITSINPPQGTSSNFPVTILGIRFDNPKVTFEQTVMPVVRIDGRAIGDGEPGPVVQRLRKKFHQFAAISSA
jgi:hypothetical protein